MDLRSIVFRKIQFLIITFCIAFFPLSGTSSPSDDEPLTLIPQTHQGNSATQTIPDNTNTLFDIYGPVPTNEPLPWLVIGAVILIVILLLIIVLLYLKRSKDKVAPQVPPWDRALLDLADAKTMRTPELGLQYMAKASQILRNYIESRFSILSTKKTTREFLHSSELEHHQQLTHFRGELQGCLELADMAKFAHRVPEDSQLVMMEDAVTAFVMKTKPMETEGVTTNGEDQ